MLKLPTHDRRARLGPANRSQIIPLMGVAVASVLVGLPLLQPRLMQGHDTLAYLPRYVEFYEGLRHGEIFPRWAANLAFGFGEPTFNFNPPLIYYLVSGFHSVGFDFSTAENLSSLLLLLLSGLGMYVLAGEFLGRRAGFISAIGYLFAPYVLTTLYVRHAMADFAAFAFMPTALWGLAAHARDGRCGCLLVGAVSIALVLLSSLSVMVMILPALILMGAWQAWTQMRWTALGRSALCVALGVALVAFFLAPALLETRYVHIERRAERLDFRDHFLSVGQVFSTSWGYGLSVRGPHDGMGFGLGLGHLVLMGVGILLLRRIGRGSPEAARPAVFFLVLLMFSLGMTLEMSRGVWERVDALGPLQFPWRFLSLAALCSGFLCGVPVVWLEQASPRQAPWWVLLFGMGLLAANIGRARPQGYLSIPLGDFALERIASKGIPATQREFEPIWVLRFPTGPPHEPLTFVRADGRILNQWVSPAVRDFVVTVGAPTSARASTFYFPGWTVYVDGVEQPVRASVPDGLMEFDLVAGQHFVKLVFAATPARLWGRRVSLLAGLGTVIAMSICLARATQHTAPSGQPRPEAARAPDMDELGA